MKDFTPLLRPSGRKFDRSVAEERLEAPESELEVITPLRGLDGVRSVSFADHTARAPRSLYAPPPEPKVEAAPAPPAGPTEEEVAARVAEAEAAVRAELEAKLAEQAAEHAAQLEVLQGVVEAVQAHQVALTAEARAQAGGLVLGAIGRVCGELPEALRGLLRDRLSQAAESLVGATEVVVRVRPEDIGPAATLLGDRPGWRLEPDPHLTGGCVASSEAGTIDGSLSAAMEGIHAAAAIWRAESGVEGER